MPCLDDHSSRSVTREITDRANLEEHYRSLLESLSETRQYDLLQFEFAELTVVREQLLPLCCALSDAATRELSRVVRTRDEHTPPPGSARLSQTEASSVEVSFMARLEANRQAERLLLLRDSAASAETLLLACDRAIRRIERALSAAIDELAVELGLPPSPRRDQKLASALVVRRAYARLLFLPALPAEGDEELFRVLRGVGTRIGILKGKEAYSQMRLEDRILVRTVQRRILLWLREPARERSHGRELLSDVETALQMLRMISHRAELREHDLDCLQKAQVALRRHATIGQVRTMLRDLDGLDAELDEFLLEACPVGLDALPKTLDRLLASLGGTTWG